MRHLHKNDVEMANIVGAQFADFLLFYWSGTTYWVIQSIKLMDQKSQRVITDLIQNLSKFLLRKLIKLMSVIGLNKCVCKFTRLRPHQAIWNAAQYEFVMILFIQIPEMLRFGILLSQCVCVWWEISLLFLLIPHLSSFIFNPPPPPPTPLPLQMSPASWRSTFLRSC